MIRMMTVDGREARAAPLIRSAMEHLRAGRVAESLPTLEEAERAAAGDVNALAKVGELYAHCGRHRESLRAYRAAGALRPNDPQLLFNLAGALTSIGDMRGAEAAYDAVIAREPGDFDAYYNRATLRRQAADANHVAAMESTLARIPAGHKGEAALCYALAKELEDLGEDTRAFTILARGAAARRRMLAYRVEDDERAMASIAKAFSATALRAVPRAANSARPIFVLGLPRSGTTLTDRILDCHGDAESIGETPDFAAALVRLGGPATPRSELIDRSITFDMESLGRSYIMAANARGTRGVRTVDKTPLNFLYLGLIAGALPAASVIHLMRDPMDVCFAMYRTLFRMGYPFSYDLIDLGRYYLAYRGLMAHWHEVLPGFVHDVAYERLTADPDGAIRRLLDLCGLPFDPACLASHANPRPVSTASAAQVREPIHTRSVGAWRRFAAELEPLARILRAGGVEVA